MQDDEKRAVDGLLDDISGHVAAARVATASGNARSVREQAIEIEALISSIRQTCNEALAEFSGRGPVGAVEVITVSGRGTSGQGVCG